MMTRILLAGLAFAGAAQTAMADPTDYPLTLENCGQSVTFDAAPASAVTVGQSATEILYALDLSKKVSGTSVWFNEVLPEYKEINDGIERLADNDPSFEAIVGKRPGLVAIEYEWHIGPEGIIASREQFHELKIPTYVLPTDCVGKDNSQGIDGTRLEQFSTAALYQGVGELAQIFDVADRGNTLLKDLRSREAAAIKQAKSVKAEDISAVFWYSSADMDIDPYVAGQKGAAGYMMKQLGIRNVVQSDEEWPTVGWETLAQADPSIIVIARMNRRRFPADDFEKKLEFLRNDPVTSQMTAVKKDRIVVMDASAMSATIRLVGGLETLTEAMEKIDLGS